MGREYRQVALLEAGIYSSDDRVGLVLWLPFLLLSFRWFRPSSALIDLSLLFLFLVK